MSWKRLKNIANHGAKLESYKFYKMKKIYNWYERWLTWYFLAHVHAPVMESMGMMPVIVKVLAVFVALFADCQFIVPSMSSTGGGVVMMMMVVSVTVSVQVMMAVACLYWSTLSNDSSVPQSWANYYPGATPYGASPSGANPTPSSPAAASAATNST